MITIRSLLSKLAARNMPDDDFDVSQVTGEMTGYVVDGTAPTVGFMDPILRLYTVMSGEADKMYFSTRDATIIDAITEDDLIDLGEDEQYEIERIQEYELPNSVVVQYMDPEIRFNQSAQQHRLQSGRGQGEMSTGGTVVMEAAEAHQASRRMLLTLHGGRNKIRFKTIYKHVDLLPGDIIDVTLGQFTYTVVIMDRNVENSTAVEFQCIEVSPAVQNPGGTGDTGEVGSGEVTYVPSALIPLDIPLLNNGDDGYGLYAGAYPAAEGTWGGTAIQLKLMTYGEESYTTRANATSQPVHGVATTALASPTDFEVLDQVNTVTVDLTSSGGTLDALTEEEVTADPSLNLMSIGSELIQFIDVTDHGDGTFTISNLLRGRFGTEQSMGTHSNTDTVVLMEFGKIVNVTSGASEHNQDLDVRMLPLLGTATPTTDTIEPLFNVRLRPLAPTDIMVTRNASGDATITWARRSRHRGALFADPPLGESIEQYQLTVYENGTTTGRVVTVTGSASYTYTAADQSTDGISGSFTGLDIRVKQYSAEYGYGLTGFRGNI